jgi:hypothetical protein
MKQLMHTVMWRLQGDAAQRTASGLKCIAAFDKVRQAASADLPGLLDLQIAFNDTSVNDSPDAWHLVLVTRFTSTKALEDYNQHPAHVAIKVLMAPLKQSRAVVDAWV